MKKAATLLMLVIFMIGSGYAANVKPGDTTTTQKGTKIINKSEAPLSVADYTDFGQIHINGGDSILMNGVWVRNFLGAPIAMQVELYSLNKIFQETVKLNRLRFKDVNLIHPGDSVVLYPRYVGGPYEIWAADSVQNLGKNDCMWRICQRYRAGSLETTPIILELISAPIDEESGKAIISFNWWGWILLLLGFILLAGFIYWLVRRVLEEASRNADNHPPVIPGGLSDDNRNATQQIQTRLPEGSRVIRLERGRAERFFGPRRILTTMQFGDLVQRPAYILPGEKVVRVTIQDVNGTITVQYWRSHCGNSFSVFARDQFELHPGWQFVAEESFVPQVTESLQATESAAAAEASSNAQNSAEPANTSAEAAAPADNSAPAAQNGHPAKPKNELSNFDKFLNSIPKEHISGIKFTDSEEYGVSVNVKYKN